MKKTLAITTAMMSLVLAAPAFADTIEAGIGNTMTVTDSSGGVSRFYFNADNTYSILLPDGSQQTGAWQTNNGQVCLTPAGGQQACNDYAQNKSVGDSWQQPGMDGQTVTVRIVAGRE